MEGIAIKMAPLEGLRVLDLTKVLAGPICTQSLAGLGASVIKIESIGGGDESRFWQPRSHGVGAAFVAVNSGKRSVALNLKTPEAQAIVAKLAQKADIILESFAPGVAGKLGVDHATLAAGREDVIFCSISGWGQRGPRASAPGYDAVLQAYSGLMSMNGEPDQVPVRLPGSPIDQVTGLYATQAILAAVIQRGRTGKGAQLEVSLLESAIKLLAPNLQAYWLSGVEPQRMGSGHPSVAPYEVFETKDRPILLAIANEKFWRLFCSISGLDEVRDDPRFATNPARVENRAEVVALVADRMKTMTAGEWMRKLDEVGIPASPLNTIADVAKDEQAEALQMYREMVHPEIGRIRTVCEPIMFDGARAIPDLPAPILGQHTQEVLAGELGYTSQEIDALVTLGAIEVRSSSQESLIP